MRELRNFVSCLAQELVWKTLLAVRPAQPGGRAVGVVDAAALQDVGSGNARAGEITRCGSMDEAAVVSKIKSLGRVATARQARGGGGCRCRRRWVGVISRNGSQERSLNRGRGKLVDENKARAPRRRHPCRQPLKISATAASPLVVRSLCWTLRPIAT